MKRTGDPDAVDEYQRAAGKGVAMLAYDLRSRLLRVHPEIDETRVVAEVAAEMIVQILGNVRSRGGQMLLDRVLFAALAELRERATCEPIPIPEENNGT